MNWLADIAGFVFGVAGWVFSTFDQLFSIMLLAVAIVFLIMVKPLLDVIRLESRDQDVYDDWQDVRDALRLQGAVARRRLQEFHKKGNRK